MSLALSRWSASTTCTSSWDLSVNLTPHTWHSRLSRSTPAYFLRSARTVPGSWTEYLGGSSGAGWWHAQVPPTASTAARVRSFSRCLMPAWCVFSSMCEATLKLQVSQWMSPWLRNSAAWLASVMCSPAASRWLRPLKCILAIRMEL